MAAVAVGGCGSESMKAAPLASSAPSIGPSPDFRPPSLARRAAQGATIAGLRCGRAGGERYGVHLELFANKRVVLIPPGIGIAPPRERDGAYVRGGRCSYPIRTREPTGVIEVAREGRTLGDLFAIWGQPLSANRLASFTGPTSAYVNGRRVEGDPKKIPLTRHAQIVLEVGGYVRPHARYRFPPGL